MNSETLWCEGCLRSIEEIQRWSTASDTEKKRVWEELALRAETLLGSSR